jgi:hypothetical protein
VAVYVVKPKANSAAVALTSRVLGETSDGMCSSDLASVVSQGSGRTKMERR